VDRGTYSSHSPSCQLPVVAMLSGLSAAGGNARLSGCGKSRRGTGQLSASRFRMIGRPEVGPHAPLGLALLRKAWFNFDLVWAVALVATGIVTLLI
jgi:hypothetical protein